LAAGNNQADKYEVHLNINNPGTFTGDVYALYVSRNLVLQVYDGVGV
jgi:hypothetical protein